jgi:plasmid stability protein
MGQLVVRNLEDSVKEQLRRRAKAHGRSMEEEVRDILRAAAKVSVKNAPGLGTQIAARFRGIGMELQRLPPEPARPARFDP